MARYNWKPVVGSFLTKLIKAKFVLVAVDDGGSRIPVDKKSEAVDAVDSVDDSHLYVTDPNGFDRWIYIVLGNDPEELVADYSCRREYDDSEDKVDPLDAVLDEFTDLWAGKKCPRSDSESRYDAALSAWNKGV